MSSGRYRERPFIHHIDKELKNFMSSIYRVLSFERKVQNSRNFASEFNDVKCYVDTFGRIENTHNIFNLYGTDNEFVISNEMPVHYENQ